MKNSACCAMVLFLSAFVTVEARTKELFVAMNGSDKNPGTLKKPFATLQKAQLEARKQKSCLLYTSDAADE